MYNITVGGWNKNCSVLLSECETHKADKKLIRWMKQSLAACDCVTDLTRSPSNSFVRLGAMDAHMETAASLILFLEYYGNCRVLETDTRLLEHFSVTLSPPCDKGRCNSLLHQRWQPNRRKRPPKKVGFCPFFFFFWRSIFPLMEGRPLHEAAGRFSLADSSNPAAAVRVSSTYENPIFFCFHRQMRLLHRRGETRTGRSQTLFDVLL